MKKEKNKSQVAVPGFLEILNEFSKKDSSSTPRHIPTKKELFINFIETYNKILKDSSDLKEKFKIDLFDYEDPYHACINNLLSIIFDEQTQEWIHWWLHERITYKGEILKAHHKNGKEIKFDSSSDLWDFIQKQNKKYGK